MLLSTAGLQNWTIPLMTRRSSVLRAPGWFFGNSAPMTPYCASLNQFARHDSSPPNQFDLNHRHLICSIL
jgi:hypothetical protein